MKPPLRLDPTLARLLVIGGGTFAGAFTCT